MLSLLSDTPKLSEPFSGTWPISGSMQSGRVCRRRRWVPPMAANGSGYWPTATAADSRASGATYEPTDTHHAGTTLTDKAVRQWPTPTASNPNEGEPIETWMARRARLQEKHGNGNGVGMPLGIAARLWHTPTAAEGWSGPGIHTQRGQASNLRTQVSLWATPTARDAKGPFGRHTRGGQDLPSQAVKDFPTGHRSPTTSTDGSTSSIEPRYLNPLFVEWLMGWPLGWTDCTRSATESYQSWLRRHSSLLRTALASLRSS